MGQEIFYCGTCKTLLRTRDLEKGTAVRHDDFVFCKGCAPATSEPPPTDSTRTRIPGPRTPRQGVPPAPARAPLGVILAGVGGIVLLLVLGLLAAGGSKPPPRKEDPPSAPPAAVVVEPLAEPKPPTPPRIVEPRPNPKPVNREPAARKLLEEARAFVAASPDDLDGGVERARRALLEAEGTPAETDARRLDEELRAKLKARVERKRAAIQAALGAEKFGEALTLLAAEKWPEDEARAALDKAWTDLKEKLFAARKKGAEADAKALAARADAWGVDALRAELKAILASPVEVDPTPETLAFRRKLAELPLPVDAAAALKELEKLPGAEKAELDALRLAADVQRDIPIFVQKLKPGQELLGGRLVRATAHSVELAVGDERLSRPLVELSPAAWCELLQAPPRAAQVFRSLEGDLAPGEPLPPGILALAQRAARELNAPVEAAARQLFAEAERDFEAPTSRLGGLKYLAIPKDTIFGRRAKGVVEERLQASQEVFLGADDLGCQGQFLPSEAIKGVPTFTMEADGRGADSAVLVEAVLGETTRAWVYAAACCQEMMALGLQAPDLMGPNPKDLKEQITFSPGAPSALPLKISAASLRVKHGHNGREVKWIWIPLPLPKASSGGPRKFRIVAEREGTSIAYVWLSIGRPGPPREAELKDFEKTRTPLEPVAIQTGTLLREGWINAPGHEMANVLTAPGYPDKPNSSDRITSFEGPQNVGNDYVTRVRGYVHAPLTGNYVFFVASDDASELFLSPDESPGRKVKIAAVLGVTSPRGWTDNAAAKSAIIPLKAGKRYYVELLHKEGGGEDHFAVGWQLPDGVLERPIPGNRLSPYVGSGRPPRRSFYRGINLGGPALVIDGQSWEGKDAPNLAVDGKTIDRQDVPLNPPVDGPKAQMIRASAWRREGTSVTLTAVPPGKYVVYVYVWEDTRNEIFDILLNNRVLKSMHNSGAPGHWDRLGPWPVDVADGKIELKTTGPADANISGLEVWRQNR